jgi:AraC-like DNA-binding protein
VVTGSRLAEWRSGDHDRNTGMHDRLTTAVRAADRPTAEAALRGAIAGLRLSGAVFLRAEYREPWAYESLPGPVTAGMLRPGSERVILFHVVASGACWVSVGEGPRHWARAGDVIVLPYGHQHSMGGVDEAEPVSIATFMQSPPWPRLPVLRHGAWGSRTDVVCGYLHSDDPLFHPAHKVFPPVFVVRPPSGTAAEWVRANVAFALQQTSRVPAQRDPGATRLPELLLVEVLRLHLATAPFPDRVWAPALSDPVLGPALALVHGCPERRWTVPELAASVGVSRSLLDDRFRTVLGCSPMRYLADWRMHVARELLQSTDLGIVGIARRVGYDSEEAFSRAFKRSVGSSPGAWRKENSGR